MNKIQKWLIHKLGGFSELPLSEPKIVRKPYKIEPICSVLCFRYGRYEHCLSDVYKETLADGIARELLKGNLMDIRKLTTNDGTIELRAKVYVVRGEHE